MGRSAGHRVAALDLLEGQAVLVIDGHQAGQVHGTAERG